MEQPVRKGEMGKQQEVDFQAYKNEIDNQQKMNFQVCKGEMNKQQMDFQDSCFPAELICDLKEEIKNIYNDLTELTEMLLYWIDERHKFISEIKQLYRPTRNSLPPVAGTLGKVIGGAQCLLPLLTSRPELASATLCAGAAAGGIYAGMQSGKRKRNRETVEEVQSRLEDDNVESSALQELLKRYLCRQKQLQTTLMTLVPADKNSLALYENKCLDYKLLLDTINLWQNNTLSDEKLGMVFQKFIATFNYLDKNSLNFLASIQKCIDYKFKTAPSSKTFSSVPSFLSARSTEQQYKDVNGYSDISNQVEQKDEGSWTSFFWKSDKSPNTQVTDKSVVQEPMRKPNEDDIQNAILDILHLFHESLVEACTIRDIITVTN